ncbi:hypothetical protein CDV31_016820 [Fusarium ambrosium]|uniref:Uncharacterized protein n=1 Tax=Fusarium ambrosium TaxID=131363 RepID=A0A428S152_9HYPO|nr:hypothetical protein CDV31_016820 [Fusarium ambrosium]
MATGDVITAVPIPGLQRPFTKCDMKESTAMYNGLPRIQAEMHVGMDRIKELVEIIARHDQLGRFSFHLVHRHDHIANDTVRLESDLGVVPGKWNKATSIDSLDLQGIHGVVFKFIPKQNRLVPFEFAEGPSPISASDVNDKFVQEFTGYLIENNLTDTFALEVVHPAEVGQPNECTAEVEVDTFGTVVLPKSMVNAKEFLPTGWPGILQSGESEPPPGQTWAKKVDESHKVFINKPVGAAGELVDELVRQGVIKV